MREILFRGKLKTDNGIYRKGEWVYGCYVDLIDGTRKIPHIYGEGEVITKTVGQYTGLTDKGGKKIFEGDIVESRYDDKYPVDVCYEVVIWHDNGWGIQEGDATPDRLDEDGVLKYSVVVGNIHDNPELLKGGSE